DVVQRAALVVGAPLPPGPERPEKLLEVRHDDRSAGRAEARQHLLAEDTDRLERLLVRRVPTDPPGQPALIESPLLEAPAGARDLVRRSDADAVLVEALDTRGLRERAGEAFVARNLLDDLAQLGLRDRPRDVLRALPGPRDGVEVHRHVRRGGARVV